MGFGLPRPEPTHPFTRFGCISLLTADKTYKANLAVGYKYGVVLFDFEYGVG